ncbi:MAG: 2'-5' RNA ligase family protein [Dehalococcoidia bacterium]
MVFSGVVSLLEERYSRKVMAIWDELREALRQPPVPTTIPHFTYHLAGDYDSRGLRTIGDSLAIEGRGFSTWTNGLGLFTHPKPVLYISLVRNLELSRFQRWVWYEVDKAAEGSVDYYTPERWMPHITLIEGLDVEALLTGIRLLGARDFNWKLDVDNLAFIRGTDSGHKVEFELKLQPRHG